ncbi:DEAD/SNF2-like helicase [Hokovirus HKV1]|uniref:DEAD/SNF2-like helicase n=1 Tax=Hokovirus HKV1 TaxID=1977638 RepID=A0A1V0SGF6_9VIRU|nr:DEAD/SNF2-like helicase [Hokovirus HKV1]
MLKNTNKNYDQYIDFKINGRFFPSYMLKNYSEYQLPEPLQGDDPCNENVKTSENKLREYQTLMAKYLDYTSPYKDILLYHGLGSGKTITTINIYNMLYSYTPGWNVFILIKASLKKNWLRELEKWIPNDDKEYRMRNIVFINYDSPFADKNFLDAVKNSDASKKSMFIIEEVHIFISNVYGNLKSGAGKKAQTIYDYIIREKRDNPDTRVVLLSGTPAVNEPFELALLFNLLRRNIFPKNENEFNRLFISKSGFETINKRSRNLFMRRIMGLVSYYAGTSPAYFARKNNIYEECVMSEYHEEIYTVYEEFEKKMASHASSNNKSYMSYTRQASNFVFPFISQSVNGENRPRPNKFRISERDAEKLLQGKANLKQDKATEKFTNVIKYKETLDLYANSFREYLNEKHKKDKENNHTIDDDVKSYLETYKGKYTKFYESKDKKSSLFIELHKCSSKIIKIIFNILKSKGPTIVYSNYVYMEGLQMLKIYLEYFNFYNFMTDFKEIPNKFGYTEFHGGIEIDNRYKGMVAYNNPDNIHGKIIKIMLISQAGAEGLSLMNVRQIHIMEPYWNEVRITQLIGRGVRQCSHKDLPMEERYVDVYRYKSIKRKPDTTSTDQLIENLARQKASLIDSFLNILKEVAIDCKLYEKDNMLNEQYNCFQFDQDVYFRNNVGPAYKDDIYDDIKNDNGLYSKKSAIVNIKVIEINAVIILTKPNEEPVYTKPKKFLYHEKTGIVYDYNLHYAYGKVAHDEDNLPVKLNNDTYVIDYVVPIPLINKEKF